jgi:TatD DNase family protein
MPDMFPELIDIGINLAHRSFQNDSDEVILRARSVGVTRMVVTGTSVSESQLAQQLARRYPGILYATAGIHPHDARHWHENTADALRELAATPEVVALGEMGLDFNRNYSPRPQQEKAFAAQLELAAQWGMPVFLHERDAQESFLKCLARYRNRLGSAVIHCFTGTKEALAAYLDLDLHIGITGWICDERRGLHLRDLVQSVPLERMLLETDAPYLLPRNLQLKPKNRRNEPAFLPHVLAVVADCLQLPPATVANATTQAACDFFGLPRKDYREATLPAEQTRIS